MNKTIEYLKQVERLNSMIANKTQEIYDLKCIATNITAVIKDIDVQVNGEKDRLGSSIAKIVDLERETEAMVDGYIAKRGLIISQIDKLENVDEYNVLSMKYVLLKPWSDIAKSISYSRRGVERLHKRALDSFEKKYGSTYLGENQ